MKVQLFLLMLLAVCSCKSPEEKLAGKWKIESYTNHGADSMAQLNRLHQNDIITLTDNMPDPMGGWGITSTHLDTVYGFGGKWQLHSKKELRFFLLGTSVSNNGKAIKAWNTYYDSSTMRPFVLLDGNWNIEKQGRSSLHLESKTDKEIKLKIKRQ